MEKYAEADSSDVASMTSDLTDYMNQYTETMEKMNSIDENELSSADLAYYSEVNLRISQKFSKANL